MTADGWTGREIDGRYVVEGLLGQGGMGVVLRARHKFTGAEVALKVLHRELEVDPEIQVRFLAEARAAGAIGHPAIVQVLDAGRLATGSLYMAMELLVGRPLRIPLARGELAHADVRRIMLELCDVLGAAHARGFVHRDLKPENVFLVAPAGTVKLLDFGIAKVLADGILRARTATGALLGTPAYMAPEQLHDPSGVDARADVWALGVMLFEMLTGRLPFAADTTADLLAALASAEPDSIRRYLPHASPALEQLFARALARDPRYRFASACELAHAVQHVDFGPALVVTPGTAVTMMTGAAAPVPVPAPATAPSPAAPPVASFASAPSPAVPPVASFASAPAPSPAAPPVASFASAPASAASSPWSVAPLPSESRSPSAASFASAPSPPTSPSTAVAPAMNRARWILGAFALLAVIVGASIAVGQLRQRAADPPPAPAPPRPKDTWSGPSTPVVPPDAAEDPQIVTARECAAGCDRFDSCGMAYATCQHDCETNVFSHRCVTMPDCGDAANCTFTIGCQGSAPNGRRTCKQTLACLSKCKPGQLACACACYGQMAPLYGAQVARVVMCAARCAMDPSCIQRACAGAADDCH